MGRKKAGKKQPADGGGGGDSGQGPAPSQPGPSQQPQGGAGGDASGQQQPKKPQQKGPQQPGGQPQRGPPQQMAGPPPQQVGPPQGPPGFQQPIGLPQGGPAVQQQMGPPSGPPGFQQQRGGPGGRGLGQQTRGPPPQGQQGPPQGQWQGQRGPQGQQGPPQGQRGPQGQQGPPQGQRGPEGQGPPQGQRGPQGQQGPPQGQRGPQGQQGPPQGQRGPQGQQGPPQGQRGPQGQQGPPQGQGQRGPQGQQGPPQGQWQGQPSPQGQQGPPQGQWQGQRGPQGPPVQGQQGPPQGQYPGQQSQPPHGQQGQQGYPPQEYRQGQQGPPQGQQAGPPQRQGQQRGAKQQQQRRGPPQQDVPGTVPASPTLPESQTVHQPTASRPQQHGDRPASAVSSPPSSAGSSRAPSVASTPSAQPIQQISTGMAQLSLVKPGTKGRKIPVESNHLTLSLGKLKSAIHYDVDINPDTPKNMLRDVMNIFRQRHYPKNYPAFDGRKNLYSPTKLFPGHSLSDNDIVVEREGGRPRTFKVEVKFAAEVDMTPLQNMLSTKTSPQQALQCVDIVLRMAPAKFCIPVGRSFFTQPRDRILELGNGMEMYYGFYQSAIRGWKPLLNVDVAHKAFPKEQPVLDLICSLGSDFRNTMTREHLRQPLRDFLQRDLDKFIRTLKVKYEIPGQPDSKKNYRVNGLDESAERAKFKLDDGRTITVAQYFQQVKQKSLQYPHLPCLWVGSKERKDKKILLPLEFCTVCSGQPVNRKMDETQTSAMIKLAATSTDVRKQKIMTSLQTARYNDDLSVREFGFSVGNQFERLEARVLIPPRLGYKNQKTIEPRKGVWRSDPNHFLIGATINKWTITSATRYPQKVDYFAEEVVKFAKSSGMTFTSKAVPYVQIGGRQSKNDIQQYFSQRRDFDLIFVIVPNSGPQYGFVKQAAELNVGCLTQCIKENTLQRKMNGQTIANILLKVNSKMNGTNHVLAQRPPILNRPCMIMGADVTHPSPDARDIPSVAAVTASHDPQAFRYNICWRLQPPKVEIIDDLCNIVKEQLRFFEKETKCKPERIIFFRDGVSEGQFEQVRVAEIAAIRRACKEVQKDGYEPAITFLVVQKRHHTRLFPTNSRDSEDRNNNVPAGTCVDTQITNPMMQDFYLVSHASIQGVAKPTKYCTLHDDNNMSNDDIEELAYHLCHMFTRCNRSVSYPAPTYYAHLAAARAKVYIENDNLDMSNLKNIQRNYEIKENICKGKPMFFV